MLQFSNGLFSLSCLIVPGNVCVETGDSGVDKTVPEFAIKVEKEELDEEFDCKCLIRQRLYCIVFLK